VKEMHYSSPSSALNRTFVPHKIPSLCRGAAQRAGFRFATAPLSSCLAQGIATAVTSVVSSW